MGFSFGSIWSSAIYTYLGTLDYNWVSLITYLKTPALECIFRDTWSWSIFIGTSSTGEKHLNVKLRQIVICLCRPEFVYTSGCSYKTFMTIQKPKRFLNGIVFFKSYSHSKWLIANQWILPICGCSLFCLLIQKLGWS